MVREITSEKLFRVGAHLGRPTNEYNPSTRQFILKKHHGIHLIDLSNTIDLLNDACGRFREVVAGGGKVLFVGTNTNNTTAVKDTAIHAGMPFVTGRWPGGLLTNFSSARNSIKGLLNLEDTLCNLDTWRQSKRTVRKLAIERDRRNGYLDGVRKMNKLPEALFVVDAVRNKSSILEARRLGIGVFAICSSNADVKTVDNVVPGSVDSPMATRMILEYIAKTTHKTARYLPDQPFAYIHSEIGISNAGLVDHVYHVEALIDVPDPDISVAALPSKHIQVLSCNRSDAYPISWNIAFRPIERGKAYIEVDFFRSRCRVLTLTARFRIK